MPCGRGQGSWLPPAFRERELASCPPLAPARMVPQGAWTHRGVAPAALRKQWRSLFTETGTQGGSWWGRGKGSDLSLWARCWRENFSLLDTTFWKEAKRAVLTFPFGEDVWSPTQRNQFSKILHPLGDISRKINGDIFSFANSPRPTAKMCSSTHFNVRRGFSLFLLIHPNLLVRQPWCPQPAPSGP